MAATFDINEYRVLGNSLLPTRDVERAVYPFLGPQKSLDDVQKARDALATAFRDAGYGTVIVDIPEQSVDQGIVRLRVTEGKLQSVQISGAKYYSEGHILNELPALTAGTVPKLNDLQAQLGRVAAEAPDRQITPVLKAGTMPGTVAVDLKVADHLPLHVSLEADNNNSADTTALRTTGVISYANMFQRNETLAFQYETAPENSSEVRLAALTYIGRTNDPNWTWNVYGIRSKSDVAAVGTLSVIGDGKIAGARMTRALDSTAAWSDNVTFGGDYKDFTQDVNLSGASAITPIHYIMWSGMYSFNAQFSRLQTNGSLGLYFSVRNVGSRDSDFEFNRAGAQADFLYLRGGDVLAYRYWHDWLVRLNINYQYTQSPLVNNEQFALGGQGSVRGYYASEALSDTGVAESLELPTPTLKLRWINSELIAFYDAAQGGVQLPLPSQTSHFELASTGLELHAFRGNAFDGIVEWAHVIRAGPRTERGANRVKFQVKVSY